MLFLLCCFLQEVCGLGEEDADGRCRLDNLRVMRERLQKNRKNLHWWLTEELKVSLVHATPLH